MLILASEPPVIYPKNFIIVSLQPESSVSYQHKVLNTFGFRDGQPHEFFGFWEG